MPARALIASSSSNAFHCRAASMPASWLFSQPRTSIAACSNADANGDATGGGGASVVSAYENNRLIATAAAGTGVDTPQGLSLGAYQGKALVNSITCEADRYEAVLPLIKEHGAAIICLTNGEEGIPVMWEERFEFCKRLVDIVHGQWEIPLEDMVIDTLAMPVGAEPQSAYHFFKTMEAIKGEFGLNTTCGASNFSFGLPNRRGLAAAFMPMAIGAGMTSAIMNPLHAEDIQAILGADVMMGHDPNCGNWIRKYREPAPEGAEGAAGDRRGREGRRRNRE